MLICTVLGITLLLISEFVRDEMDRLYLLVFVYGTYYKLQITIQLQFPKVAWCVYYLQIHYHSTTSVAKDLIGLLLFKMYFLLQQMGIPFSDILFLMSTNIVACFSREHTETVHIYHGSYHSTVPKYSILKE